MKIEQEVKVLLKAAGRNGIKPIWEYQKKSRYHPQQNQRHIPKKRRWDIHAELTTNATTMVEMDNKTIPNTTGTRNAGHRPYRRRRMGEIEKIQQDKQQEQHIPRKNANTQQPNISKELQHIRETSLLTQAMKKHPQINKWLTEDYTEKDVEATIRQLKNHKSHGQDGIPGETYKL